MGLTSATSSTALANHEPPWIWPRAAYIHVPFCATQVRVLRLRVPRGRRSPGRPLLVALGREMERATGGIPQEVDTIFIGGGHADPLNAGQLAELLAMVRRRFPLVPGGEWTVEANPGDARRSQSRHSSCRGVNRVSLGAQSFRPASLLVLERNHAPEEVARAIDLVRPSLRALVDRPHL